MSKRLVLIALLLPISGFSITREERMKEIENQVDKLNLHIMKLCIGVLSCPIAVFTMPKEERTDTSKSLQDYIDEVEALENEYMELYHQEQK